jgi:hypothetical protein
VTATPSGCRNRLGNAGCEIDRIEEGPLVDNGSGNSTSGLFLAVSGEDRCQFILTGVVDDLRSGSVNVSAHSHVERTVSVIGESALVSIELVRRNTEITENPRNPAGESCVFENSGNVCIVGLDDDETRIVWCLEKSIRVTVDTDNANRWISVKERTTMTSPAKCAIDNPGVRCWLEPGKNLLDHHRLVIRVVVWRGLIHGQPPGALAPKRKRAE